MDDEGFRGVTVFIPTFNRREDLQKAAESALQETRLPLCVHIFDNASTDDTETYARALAAADPRVRYTRRESNLGARENFERAFASLTGDYFVPLADDDLIYPDFLFEAVGVLDRNAEACAAVFLAEVRKTDGTLVEIYPQAPDQIRYGLLSPHDHMTDWLTHGHYHWSAVLWRRSALGLLRPPYLKVGMPSDVDFQGQLFSRAPAYLVKKAGGLYRLHDGQISQGYDQAQIPAWAEVMSRLDAAIIETRLFDAAQYAPLRQAMLTRYQGAWRDEPPISHEPDQLRELAEIVGFDLGDWPLCFSFVDRIDASRAEALRAAGDRADQEGMFTYMPAAGGEVDGATVPSTRELRHLTILRWLKANQTALLRERGDKASLSLVNEHMKGFVAALQSEADALRNSIRDLNREVEAREELIEAQREALRQAEAHSAALQQGIFREKAAMADILGSSSWRLTAPLRRAKDWLGALRRKLRGR